MNEYWLQKKTLGGWSQVTWYSDKAQAETNYIKLLANKGYSYRLVEVQTIQEDLLDEVTEVKPPEVDRVGHVPALKKAEAVKYSGWGVVNPKLQSNGWDDTSNVKWITKAEAQEQFPASHGLSGKVWLIHHARKDKIRVHADEVDGMLKDGWERGGPRTQFR